MSNYALGNCPPVDVAIIEVVAICEDRGIIPTTRVGNSASFVTQAKEVIVEINTTCALAMEGLHEIYIPQPISGRTQISIIKPDDRIGKPYIIVDRDKIAAIVISDMADSPSNVLPHDEEMAAIANHLIEFLIHEMKMDRDSHTLRPLQASIATIANALLSGFLNNPFYDLQMYSEVLQDSTFDLMDCGKLASTSASSITLAMPIANAFLIILKI